MDIAGLSIAMSQNQTMTAIGTAVLSKNLDTVEQAGADMIKMMEQSVAPNLGGTIDIRL